MSKAKTNNKIESEADEKRLDLNIALSNISCCFADGAFGIVTETHAIKKQTKFEAANNPKDRGQAEKENMEELDKNIAAFSSKVTPDARPMTLEEAQVLKNKTTDGKVVGADCDSLVSRLCHLIGKNEDVNDVKKSAKRVSNIRFYEKDYRPVPRETREIDQLAKLYLPQGRVASRDPLYPHLFPRKDEQKPVLLKREPVIFWKISRAQEVAEEVHVGHLILLNTCCFFAFDHTAKVNTGSKIIKEFRINIYKGLHALLGREKKYEHFYPLSSNICVYKIDSTADCADEPQIPAFIIEVIGSNSYKVYCHSHERQEAWLDAFRLSISNVQARQIKTSAMANKNDSIRVCSLRSKEVTGIEKNGEEKSMIGKSRINHITSFFNERGQRLDTVNEKSSDLKNEAQTYSDLTKQFRDRLENKNRNWLELVKNARMRLKPHSSLLSFDSLATVSSNRNTKENIERSLNGQRNSDLNSPKS